MQKNMALFLGDSGSIANGFRSSGLTAVPQNGDDFSGKTELEKSVALFLGDSSGTTDNSLSTDAFPMNQEGDDSSHKANFVKNTAMFLGDKGSSGREAAQAQLNQHVASAQQSLKDIAENQGAVIKK
ncbi:hypothetical protein [Piscirickettsia litoralis]|uniref:Uncharacterized protein n=1 Tax=Piscirickettsia litoralis TaxID=1891921 RepID=A0ABX2ZYE7_9GAMM|nr:hypothetical protein [Piscirickettsia litoralis]ODN41644.1 hypothetical protein BGC07_16250 [Piscirickettsia litoralis]